MLVVRIGADPIGCPIKATDCSVAPQAGEEEEDGLQPGVGHEPQGPLLLFPRRNQPETKAQTMKCVKALDVTASAATVSRRGGFQDPIVRMVTWLNCYAFVNVLKARKGRHSTLWEL